MYAENPYVAPAEPECAICGEGLPSLAHADAARVDPIWALRFGIPRTANVCPDCYWMLRDKWHADNAEPDEDERYCPRCNGKGSWLFSAAGEVECEVCRGKGRMKVTRTADVLGEPSEDEWLELESKCGACWKGNHENCNADIVKCDCGCHSESSEDEREALEMCVCGHEYDLHGDETRLCKSYPCKCKKFSPASRDAELIAEAKAASKTLRKHLNTVTPDLIDRLVAELEGSEK